MCPVTAMDEDVHVTADLGVRLGGHGRCLFSTVQGWQGVCRATDIRPAE
jgi:hypothetical protein